MKKRILSAALSGVLLSSSANALLLEGNFSATATSPLSQVQEITGNIFIDYEPARVSNGGSGVYYNNTNNISWIDITINELSLPLMDNTQAPLQTDRMVMVDSDSSVGDRLEFIDKASDTTAINTAELRRIELSFQIPDFDFLAGEDIYQPFGLDWTSPTAAAGTKLKIFHRTQLGDSFGNATYSLTALRFGASNSLPISTVSEPSSLLLLGMGLGIVGLRRRTKPSRVM
ncbi:PEP-CTERM sorting domain-containing protein [Marinobacter sp. CHS3-4]|uniref:PEP-CTERM sorting domain-containing protein n=1 Tax=Marinobacter sp. CHS3-4 TaxID=3045174 RepID=UPI0024B519E1|nr:PEP-CTERM sorting domain-containing protein [Marinobacter sp. CHS3-4]MDI9243636.1 PEP-CTERM sorting domain-containing protein [Marinobacter sp. CHS3-4]